MMRAGLLRHKLELQSKTETTDSVTGEVTQAWTKTKDVWGSIEPLRGDEQLQAFALNPAISHRIRIRHQDSITPAQRLKLGSRVFQIQSAANIFERDRTIELMCEEQV